MASTRGSWLEYALIVPDAQTRVLDDKGFAVLILMAGVQGAGRGETVNLLNEWMDPRHVQTRGFGEPTQDERERPAAWRYWNALPPKGKIGVFFGAWHTEPIMRRVRGESSDDEFAHEISEVSRLEKMLADEHELDRLLADGAHRAREVAGATMTKVRDRVGFLPAR